MGRLLPCPARLQMAQMKPQTLNQSMFQSITDCMLGALLDTKDGGKEECRKEIEGLALTPKGHCHGNRKGGSGGGGKRAQLQWEARAQMGFLPRLVCAGCSCLLCPLWMKPLIVVSGAVSQKCVMRKRQDVNMLSRKKQFHGQMSGDMKVTKKQTGFCGRSQSVFSKGQCGIQQGHWARCISQTCVDAEENIWRNKHLRSALWKTQLQHIHAHAYPETYARFFQILLGQRKPPPCLPSHAWKMAGKKENGWWTEVLMDKQALCRGARGEWEGKEYSKWYHLQSTSLLPSLYLQRGYWVTATVVTRMMAAQTEGSTMQIPGHLPEVLWKSQPFPSSFFLNILFTVSVVAWWMTSWEVLQFSLL